jgi:hypothetical protein
MREVIVVLAFALALKAWTVAVPILVGAPVAQADGSCGTFNC